MPLTQMFVSICDPRSGRQVRLDLSELLTVAVCAVLCSADEFSEIEAWAKERIDWLRGFLLLEHAARAHREVENRLHWCLDVQFNEDQSTVRTGFAAYNFAIVRHIVMNLLRLNSSRKGSIKTKRMVAATSDTFRAELLGAMTLRLDCPALATAGATSRSSAPAC